MDFTKTMNEYVQAAEAAVARYLPVPEKRTAFIAAAMNYSVLAGGKRLRPVLMRVCADVFGGCPEEMIEPFMAAIEMIHTYSLVHDDLPAMDNDQYRRGKKTTWAQYGEAIGILAGDGLLNYAYETAAKAFDYAADADDMKRIAEALRLLASKPGIGGMLGGQAVDVMSEGKPLDKPLLDFIYKMKTSALIECSMMIGAVLAGADSEAVRTIETVAEKVGIAFQIEDDILDVTSTLEVLGKPICSDEKNHKTTYVTLFGVDGASAYVQQLSNEALGLLDTLEKPDEFLRAMIVWLIHREK